MSPTSFAALAIFLLRLDNSFTVGLPHINDTHTAPTSSSPPQETGPVLPQLEHYVTGVRIEKIADTRVILHWDVPVELMDLVHKNYVSYTVMCLRLDINTVIKKVDHANVNTSIMLTPLEPGIPYSCSVYFVTSLNNTIEDSEELTFFTRELAPSDFASASNFKAARLDGDMVKMMWNGATLGDSRGFPLYTVVIREGDFHTTSKHGLVEALDALPLVRKVSNGNKTYLTLSGFDTHKSYTIQVGMHTKGGRGKYTYPSVIHCTICPASTESNTDKNAGIITAVVLCLVAMVIMVIVALILLVVIFKAYQRKKRYAHAMSEQDPIIVKEERDDE